LEETQIPQGAVLNSKFRIVQNLYNGVGGYVYMMQEQPLSNDSPALHPTHSVSITQATQITSAASFEDTSAPRYLLKVYQGKEKSKLIELYKQEATIS